MDSKKIPTKDRLDVSDESKFELSDDSMESYNSRREAALIKGSLQLSQYLSESEENDTQIVNNTLNTTQIVESTNSSFSSWATGDTVVVEPFEPNEYQKKVAPIEPFDPNAVGLLEMDDE